MPKGRSWLTLHNAEFSENAKTVVAQKYASYEGESPCEVFMRVANALCEIGTRKFKTSYERKEVFYDVMRKKKFMPAGRTLTNAGTSSALIANCVVLGVDDTMKGIMKTLSDATILQQQGCGIGFNFSNLRPAGFETKRSRGVASGPISFMRMYNDCFLTIKQQGRSGANMGMLDVDHPDIWSFISCKENEGDFSTFNISVVVTDEFMQTVRDNPGKLMECKWGGKTYRPRRVISTRNKFGVVEEVQEIDITYQQLYDRICEYAWKNGEPGIMFVDEVNRHNPLPDEGRITASNPCGEQMLHPGDNCNLGSINVAAHFDKENQDVDWIDLENTVQIAVEMLDNTIELFDHAVSLIDETAQKNRRIGLGIMGFADLLIKMNIRYGEEKSFKLANKLMHFINEVAFRQSILLGYERGPFPNYENSIYFGGTADEIPRNVARTTVAPTGSISMLCDVNGGIEPYFSLAYQKSTRSGDLFYLPAVVEESIKETFLLTHAREILGELKYNGGTLPEVVERLGITDGYADKRALVTSKEISPAQHVHMQSVFQNQVNNSISKTINLSNEATIEDISGTYMQAWRECCKSITVYRDGSRQDQIISEIDKEEIREIKQKLQDNKQRDIPKNEEVHDHIHEHAPRPKVVKGYTEKIATARGNAYITVNFWEYNGTVQPFEVFAAIGKEGGDLHSDMSALTRMISLGLRTGVPVQRVIESLKGIGSSTFWEDGVRNEGPVDAISQALENAIKHYTDDNHPLYVVESYMQDAPEGTIVLEDEKGKFYDYMSRKIMVNEEPPKHISEGDVISPPTDFNLCPQCGKQTIIYVEGCRKCPDVKCNWSSC